jgi:hypothetical protein
MTWGDFENPPSHGLKFEKKFMVIGIDTLTD